MKYVFLGALIALVALSFAVSFWRPDGADDRIELIWCTDDSPTRREQTALFNALNPTYRVKLDPTAWGMEKTIVQSLAGVGPDIFDCYSAFQLAAYVRSGAALDVTDQLKARGVSPDEVWPCLRPLIMIDGRLYGHPGNAHAHAFWYNKRMFDEAGLPYPTDDWTWEECIETARKLTKRDSRGRIVQSGLISLWEMGQWDPLPTILHQWGARLFSPEGTRCVLDTPEAGAAAQFLQDLAYTYGVMPTPTEALSMATAGGWGTGAISLFGAEKGAMALGGRWWLNLLRQEPYAHLKLGAVSIPRGPMGQTVTGGGRASLVNAAGKHIDGALAFLEFLHSREWNELVNRQADALGPVMKYSYTDTFLHNPDYPKEDFNQVWRGALEHAIPVESSPYVNGHVVDRALIKQTDLLRLKAKSGAEAMRDAAAHINAAMVDTLRRDPKLKERYMAAVALGAPKAWDRPEDAP